MNHPWAFMWVSFCSKAVATCSLFEPVSQHDIMSVVEPSLSFLKGKGFFHIALVETARKFKYPWGYLVNLSWNLQVKVNWYWSYGTKGIRKEALAERERERKALAMAKKAYPVSSVCAVDSVTITIFGTARVTGTTAEFSWWQSTVGLQLPLVFFTRPHKVILLKYHISQYSCCLEDFNQNCDFFFPSGILYCFCV